MLTFNTASYCW